jgi:hypothetical protein
VRLIRLAHGGLVRGGLIPDNMVVIELVRGRLTEWGFSTCPRCGADPDIMGVIELVRDRLIRVGLLYLSETWGCRTSWG